jgi:diguanylate cyclase (GGDEF)-like protein
MRKEMHPTGDWNYGTGNSGCKLNSICRHSENRTMNFLKHASLRQMLILPYVLLVMLAAAIIGLLSYRAGSDAVDTLSDYVLSETVGRIAQAVDKHISGSEAVLETAFPSDVPAPVSIKADLESLRTRFWLATSVHRDPNNYAYYGGRDGQFIGLWRYSESEAELRLLLEPEALRSIYRFSTIRGELKNPVKEERPFDPRERPWYKAGQGASSQTWTAIYIDFKTLQLVGTRARRVNNAKGEFEGVVATDLSLQHLNEFLKTLKLTGNAYALIFEPDGNLVATSRGPHIRKGAGEDNTRLNAALSEDGMIKTTFKAINALVVRKDARAGTHTTSFVGPNGEIIQAGYERLRDKAGLDWIVAVAIPRSDFMQSVTDNVHRTAYLALLAAVLIALTGVGVLNVIARDLRRLAAAARSFEEGSLDAKIPIERRDEIGDLAKSFSSMQRRLSTDRLTGIANRESILRRIEDRIVRQRRRGDHHPFAVLFVDMNAFKQINDRFGHEVGDQVLIEVGQRLNKSLRDTDVAARFGGDEFVVLLSDVANRNDALSARDKLEAVLAEPFQALRELEQGRGSFAKGAAIGVALCPDDGLDIETLLKHADADMYQRKPIAPLA